MTSQFYEKQSGKQPGKRQIKPQKTYLYGVSGNLGADPVVRQTRNGEDYACCTLFENQTRFSHDKGQSLEPIRYRLHFFDDLKDEAVAELKKGDFIKIKKAVWQPKYGKGYGSDGKPQLMLILNVIDYEMINEKEALERQQAKQPRRDAHHHADETCEYDDNYGNRYNNHNNRNGYRSSDYAA